MSTAKAPAAPSDRICEKLTLYDMFILKIYELKIGYFLWGKEI